MQKIMGFAVLCVSCWILAGVAEAQNAAPPEPGIANRTTPGEVSLDLVVRDKKGKLVKSIEPGEVEIYEDGIRQQLVDFRLVTGSATPRLAPAAAAPKPGSLSLKALNLVCIVFQNLDPGPKKWAVDATREFLRSILPPDSWVGIFNLTSRVTMLQPFTTDRSALIQASRNAFAGPSADFAKSAAAVLSANPNVVYAGQNEISGAATADAGYPLMALIRQLATLPGHKTVLLLSSPLTNAGDPDRLQRAISAAGKAGITFYAIDAVAAGAPSTAPASDPVALRALSEGTGGFLIASADDLRKPLQRLVDDVYTHYEAVYRPASGKHDGTSRKIEIKLSRPDLKVEACAGYLAMPGIKGAPLRPFEIAALKTLNDKPQPHAFDFRLGVYQFRPQAENSQFGVAYEVPVSNVTVTAVPEQKKHRLHVALFALVKGADGQAVDKFSQDFAYDIPDLNLPEMLGQPISYTHPLSLPPGSYTIETVVVDQEAHRSSVGAIPIDNPERKGLSLSSVILVKQVESVVGQGDPTDPFQFQGRRVVPEMAASLSPTAQPYLYFVVYPDKANAEKPAVQIQVSVDGQVVAEQEADLSAPDSSGAIPVLIGGAPVRPGNYEMRVTALQGNDSAEQSVKYSVAQGDLPAAQP